MSQAPPAAEPVATAAAPGEECEWIGGAKASIHRVDDNSGGGELENGEIRYVADISHSFESGVSDGTSCGATTYASYNEVIDGASLCPDGETLQRLHEVIAFPNAASIGFYYASLSADDPRVFALNFESTSSRDPGAPDRPGEVTTEVTGCFTNSTTTPSTLDDNLPNQYTISTGTILCADGRYPEDDLRGDVQAVVGSCSYSSNSSGSNVDYQYSWRFRRAACNTSVDSDSDGLSDCREYGLGTDPNNADTDGDGRSDGDEIAQGTNPLIPDTVPDGTDTDGDGRSDTEEGRSGDGTGVDSDSDDTPDYLDDDSDNDGISDADESDGDCDGDHLPDWRDADSCGGGGSCAANPVPCYAPLVRFHPREFTFPMDLNAFVDHSTLKFAHNQGCEDKVVDTTIDPARLGAASSNPYTQRQNERMGLWQRCLPAGRRYAATELTRPGDEDRPASLDDGEGFYLDLDNQYRLGTPPGPDDVVHETIYYSYDPGRLPNSPQRITYWFMYGFNQGSPFLGGAGTRIDRHEGEWERITVFLSADGTPETVRYFAHECDTPMDVAWDAAPKFEGTHPVVYSALGAHASYPDVRDVPLRGLCRLNGEPGPRTVGQGAGDQTRVGGPVWRTWETVADVAAQPWYGFGGAWGARGTRTTARFAPCETPEDVLFSGANCRVNVTGPLAPPWKPRFRPKS